MGQSYRIRTELGVNKTIQVQLDQEFEFLEILSLKLQQEDIYLRACSDYGVIVGRVTANNGLGIPNARVSVFIPIEVIDQSNPLVTSLYPYKSPTDKNEDGYRYNLLPYVQSHTGHSPTGTLPSRLDVLTGKTVSEIYDKYYKFTAKTNDSGDYMIMGVPVGEQNLVMDVDLSDIGEFSLTPQDLIRIGRATEAQVAGNRFKTSTDLNSLPQIINLTKTIEVSPLWGEPSICQIAINRLDFDLRDDANIDIQPTSVFMGSIYSTNDQFRVRGEGGKIRDDFGNLCQLQAGPGQILAIRQTIFQDTDGNPILEQYRLEQNGNVIDGNGSWLVELPMNLDYFITNEFGEKVLSNDPTIGVPTKGKYRFKIKWQQSSDLTEQTRRPYYLVPNVREFGWTNTVTDPNIDNVSQAQKDQLQSSYYFGLDWSGYTKGITSVTQRNNKLNQIINCEDTFYQFDFNRVYTVSGLIDQYKNGGRGRFVGIKEIDNNECAETVNKFPVNEGFRNFDLIYFLFAFLMQIFQIIGLPLLVLYHFVSWLWNNFAVVIVALMIGFVTKAIIQTGIEAFSFISAAVGNPFTWNMVLVAVAILFRLGFYTFLLTGLIKLSKKLTGKDFKPIKLPMVQYPDCQSCQCDNGGVTEKAAEDAIPPPGFITQTSSPLNYQESMTAFWSSRLGMTADNENYDGALASLTQSYPQSIGGNPTNIKNPTIFKTSKSSVFTLVDYQGGQSQIFTLTYDLPIGERINIYNLRQKYFNNYNKIKVTFNSPTNYSQNTQKFHYDNTLTVLSTEAFEPGTILTFVNPSRSNDPNFKFTGSTANGQTYNGIWGKIPNNARQINVKYATSQTSDTTVTYNIPAGDTPTCTDSVSINVTEPGILTYQTCLGYTSAYTASVGSHTITNLNGILTDSLTGDLVFTIVGTGQNQVNYSYPSDIEYYQVVTAITVTTTTVNNQKYYSLPSLAPVNSNNQTANPSFWNLITTNSRIIRWVKCDAASRDWWNTSPTQEQGYVDYNDFNGTSINNFSEQKVLILQRGVDPYSPTYINRYGIGKILGHASEDAVVITAETKLNIPIQKLPNGSTTTVQKHDNQVNIFSSSYFFTPGVVGNNNPGFQYIPYSSSAVGYYGALDSSPSTVNSLGLTYYSSSFVTTQSNGSVLSRTTNYFYPQNRPGIWPPNFFRGSSDTKYDNSEDLSGGAILIGTLGDTKQRYIRPGKSRCAGIQHVETSEWNSDFFRQTYFSPNLYPTLTGSPLSISNGTLNVMRTDRLPSSDYADNGENWEGSVSLLQQNLGFQIYNIFGGDSANGLSFSTGAQIPTADLEGQYAVNNVFTSLNTCEKMVGLTCYSGNGVSFGIKTGCEGSDTVDSGCYVMVQKPLTDLFNGKDFRTFAEWGFRYRFFYGLCRGILAQSFTNNWVNGSLFMFPIQVDRYFDRNNKPLPPAYPKKIIYFDNDTNNFYFRSSPFVSSNSRFIGAPAKTSRPENSVNSRNLLFPTTVINLGMKDSFYDEIMFDPATAAYIMDRLNPTSYSDTSDLVNLFVISRITDETFLKQLIPLKDNSLNQLFSRNGTTLFVQPKSRVDADLAQMMSINSEVGVIPFSPEFYPITGGPNDPVVVVGALNQTPTMGVYFSSTTFNLQDKDFISPGVINFRPNPNNTAITYEYGIKSQVVPFYRWEIKQQTGTGGIPNIFGSERNNWATNYNSNSALSDIQSYPYQSLSRRSQINPHYFIPTNTTLDIYQRGYIFDVDANGNFNLTPPTNSPNDKILVGAPYHFYFGLIKGETALDKFKTKYGINE